MVFSRLLVPAILAVMLSCFCLPAALTPNFGLNNPTPTSASKHSEGRKSTPTLVEPSQASPPKPTPAQAKPSQTPLPEPTENENAPLALPAEMSGGESEKPSLDLNNSYIADYGLYKVDYPAGWSTSRIGGWHVICMDHDKFVCFNAQTEELNGRDLSAFMNDTYEIFKRSVGEYNMFKREEIQLSGYPAVMFEQSYNFEGEYNQGFAAYLINENKNTGYIVQAVIANNMEDYDLYYETLRNMVYSFSVGEQKDWK
ncbi:MAG: hypothetical protein WCG34_07755 [Leptolinea sp.]